MSLFGQTKRHTPPFAPKGRRSPLPFFAGADDKRFHPVPLSPIGSAGSSSSSGSGLFTTIYLPIPRLPLPGSSGSGSKGYADAQHEKRAPRRYIRLFLPIPPRLYARLRRPTRPLRFLLICLAALGVLILLLGFRRKPGGGSGWSPPFSEPDSLVLTQDEVAAIWEWEVLSGHHPSIQQPPEHLPILSSFPNPSVPRRLLPPSSETNQTQLLAHQQRTAQSSPKGHLVGSGPERTYVNAWEGAEAVHGYPARPLSGVVLDLDGLLEKCDFGTYKEVMCGQLSHERAFSRLGKVLERSRFEIDKRETVHAWRCGARLFTPQKLILQYVRDCLEYLRVGGGLDNGRRVRRGNYLSTFKQMYYEASAPSHSEKWSPRLTPAAIRPAGLSRTALTLHSPLPLPKDISTTSPCDPERPRVFHMFWAGPFSDKPYMAVMSFLFTQNLGLDSKMGEGSEVVRKSCRPQFWVWINPGPAAAVPNPSAKREMYEQLATNPWSAPFLHERFRDVVKFRMWNTTEQLDGVDELRDHWRDMSIFNSGGNTYRQAAPAAAPQTTTPPVPADASADGPKLGDIVEGVETTEAPLPKKKKDGLFEKVGSTSENDYDRLSVILSDLARFVLTHRYGGIYLDADTIFLRDWEELWNYRGQFAYRWSWHQKYNTAVLKLHKGSALGTFLFKTALENGLDLHPMTVSKYLKDAGLDKLLFRIPDALFDPAWLNMERYQRERPPFPYFPEFSVFFSNDRMETAGPQQLGFDGFFRGAFSYHFHNFWWLPFDKSRNFPDLGQRFIKGEKALRDAQRAASGLANGQAGEVVKTADQDDTTVSGFDSGGADVSMREDMDDELDLSWSAVMKRTFEAYLRQERPNMYGEWMSWDRGAEGGAGSNGASGAGAGQGAEALDD